MHKNSSSVRMIRTTGFKESNSSLSEPLSLLSVSSSRNYGDPHRKGFFLFNLSFCKVGFSDLSDQT